ARGSGRPRRVRPPAARPPARGSGRPRRVRPPAARPPARASGAPLAARPANADATATHEEGPVYGALFLAQLALGAGKRDRGGGECPPARSVCAIAEGLQAAQLQQVTTVRHDLAMVAVSAAVVLRAGAIPVELEEGRRGGVATEEIVL